MAMRRKIEDHLRKWKDKRDRMPIIIRGARQVGKTYALRNFANEYENSVYINLETDLSAASLFGDDIEPSRIIRNLEAHTRERISPGSTLIILDEIQSCERALTSLKYFQELLPEYHIACAGSLLGVAMNRGQYSFPVGKTDSFTMHPLDFEEFLWANGDELLANEIRHCFENNDVMPEALHNRAIDMYNSYLIVGGMPASVLAFLQNRSLLDVGEPQDRIGADYVADMSKYASPSESVKIRECYESIPAQLAKDNRKFQYKVVRNGGNANYFGASIDWLVHSGAVYRCRRTEQGQDPISVYQDLSSFKLYMGDTGMLTRRSGLSYDVVLQNKENTFMGALAENYVAQALASNGFDLFYWTSGNIAELDFVVQRNGIITAVEVKHGLNTRSKSLNEFLRKYEPDRAFRISMKNFGEGDGFLSIPLYAAFCIE